MVKRQLSFVETEGKVEWQQKQNNNRQQKYKLTDGKLTFFARLSFFFVWTFIFALSAKADINNYKRKLKNVKLNGFWWIFLIPTFHELAPLCHDLRTLKENTLRECSTRFGAVHPYLPVSKVCLANPQRESV